MTEFNTKLYTFYQHYERIENKKKSLFLDFVSKRKHFFKKNEFNKEIKILNLSYIVLTRA